MTGQSSKDASSSIWLAVDRVGLPDKKYFKIGEVASLVGVEPHVLRYWQTQFPQIRPQKSRSGHRLYRRKDVETLLLVRELLHVQRFTIAGARQALRGLVKSERPSSGLPAAAYEDASAAAPARPYAAPPRAASTEVMRLEVEGLDEDDLEDALSRQLVEARADGAIALVDAFALDEGDEIDDLHPRGALADVDDHDGVGARAGQGALGALDARQPGDAQLAAAAERAAPASRETSSPAAAVGRAPSSSLAAPASPTLPLSSSTAAAARVAVSTVAVAVTAPMTPSSPSPAVAASSSASAPLGASTASALRERARKEQLGFGFIPSNRGALEAARSEVLAMMDLIDREEAAANRLRVRPSAAKT